MLSDRRCVRGDVAVLATGLFPSQGPLRAFARQPSPRVVLNPWDQRAIGKLPPDGTVAIIGSGLTMIDAVISLQSAHHRGNILAISRHGLLPQPRRAAIAWPDFLADLPAVESLAALFRLVRQECARASAQGADWQSAIDVVRPHIARLWSRASLSERRRFLRHVRPWWESHHHRAPPDALRQVEQLREAGRLRLVAARIEDVEAHGDRAMSLQTVSRRGQRSRLLVDGVINATGVEYDWRRVDHPLVRNLLDRGLVRCDALGLGIQADEAGRVVGVDQRPSEHLFALGPPLRGLWWESTAAPDIAVQAQRLAALLGAEPATAGSTAAAE